MLIIMSRSLLLILTLALILRLINLNQSFWLDEAAQALESVRPFTQQFTIPNDFHPPLYHLLVHAFTYISTSDWWLRLSSVLPGILTVWLVHKITLKLSNPPTALLAALLLAISPYHIYYSQELRMYALSAFLASLSTYALLTYRWKLYTLSILAGIYTFYLFPFLVVAHGIWILFIKHPVHHVVLSEGSLSTARRTAAKDPPQSKANSSPSRIFNQYRDTNIFKWLISISLAFLFFLPWLPSFLTQLSGGSQLPHIWPQWAQLSSVAFWKAIPLTYTKFVLGRIDFDNNLLYAGLVLLTLPFWGSPLFLYLRNLAIPRIREAVRGPVRTKVNTRIPADHLLILLWLLIPFLLALLISLWIPLNGPWRLLFILPALPILLALGISQFQSPKLRTMLITGICVVSLTSLSLYYGNPRYQRENWRGAVTFLHQQTQFKPETLVLNVFTEPFAPINWYAPPEFPAVGVLNSLTADQSHIATIMPQITANKTTIYYFDYLDDLTDPQSYILSWLKDHGYTETAVYNFRGLGFIREFKISPYYAFHFPRST